MKMTVQPKLHAETLGIVARASFIGLAGIRCRPGRLMQGQCCLRLLLALPFELCRTKYFLARLLCQELDGAA